MRIAATLVVCLAGLGATQAWAFGSPEHRSAGDAAWKKALAELGQASPDAPARLATLLQVPAGIQSTPEEPICAFAGGNSWARFSFGQLVAIYGDWANDVPEVLQASIGPRAAVLKKIAADGDRFATPAEHDHMMSLASVNASHFSTEALLAYVKWHNLALTTAADPGRVPEALHYEALALHSYTDLFALGHMLENRELTKSLQASAQRMQNDTLIKMSGYGAFLLGGMVNFYHNGYNWIGGTVRNTAGDEWRATGDGKYFDQDNQRQRDMVVNGAAASLTTVLNVALGLPSSPTAKYRALRLLPVEYRDTHEPVAPSKQIANIISLIRAQQKNKEPIQEHGFNFGLGILKYNTEEKRGKVAYANKVVEFQGL